LEYCYEPLAHEETMRDAVLVGVLLTLFSVPLAIAALAALLCYKRARTRRSTPRAILVDGNIGAGKTTLVCALASAQPTHYRAAPEAIGPRFLAAFYATPVEYGFALQMTQHAQRSALLQEALAADEHVTLLDRSILGDYAFALWNAASGNLNAEHWTLYREQAGASIADALSARLAEPRAVRLVYLHSGADECGARQRVRDAALVGASAIPPAYMRGIEAAHALVFALVPDDYALDVLYWREYASPRGVELLAGSSSSSQQRDDLDMRARRAALRANARATVVRLVADERAREFMLAWYAEQVNNRD
jgi:deoxyadenosine/deoxycytidine kinase